jgi:hypothetical protein
VFVPYDPGAHGPEHIAIDIADVLPNRPGGHAVHWLAPPKLYVPSPHATAVEFVDPGGQMYPAVHGPLHVDVVRLTVSPKDPAAHRPLHADVFNPDKLPYWPTIHALHTPAPSRLYFPGGHIAAVLFVDPVGQ